MINRTPFLCLGIILATEATLDNMYIPKGAGNTTVKHACMLSATCRLFWRKV